MSGGEVYEESTSSRSLDIERLPQEVTESSGDIIVAEPGPDGQLIFQRANPGQAAITASEQEMVSYVTVPEGEDYDDGTTAESLKEEQVDQTWRNQPVPATYFIQMTPLSTCPKPANPDRADDLKSMLFSDTSLLITEEEEPPPSSPNFEDFIEDGESPIPEYNRDTGETSSSVEILPTSDLTSQTNKISGSGLEVLPISGSTKLHVGPELVRYSEAPKLVYQTEDPLNEPRRIPKKTMTLPSSKSVSNKFVPNGHSPKNGDDGPLKKKSKLIENIKPVSSNLKKSKIEAEDNGPDFYCEDGFMMESSVDDPCRDKIGIRSFSSLGHLQPIVVLHKLKYKKSQIGQLLKGKSARIIKPSILRKNSISDDSEDEDMEGLQTTSSDQRSCMDPYCPSPKVTLFYSLPKNVTRAKTWTKIVGVPYDPSLVLCSNHFADDDFVEGELKEFAFPRFYSKPIPTVREMPSIKEEYGGRGIKKTNSDNELNLFCRARSCRMVGSSVVGRDMEIQSDSHFDERIQELEEIISKMKSERDADMKSLENQLRNELNGKGLLNVDDITSTSSGNTDALTNECTSSTTEDQQQQKFGLDSTSENSLQNNKDNKMSVK